MNIVDSILRIIGIEKGSTTIVEKLKTMKPYIIGLAAVGRRVRNIYYLIFFFNYLSLLLDNSILLIY